MKNAHCLTLNRWRILTVGLLFLSLLSSNVVFSKTLGPSIDDLIVRLNLAISSPGFDPKTFCSQFWEPENRSICEQVPWQYVRTKLPSAKVNYPNKNPETGFLDFLNLAYECSTTACNIGLDMQAAWRDLSSTWDKKPLFSSEWLSTKALDPATLSSLSQSMETWLKKLSAYFSIRTIGKHPIYFLNDAEVANKSGFPFPSIVSGGSRGDYLVFVGSELPRSTLLHELVHTYTAYPGEWWNGHYHFPHALLNEGLATWIQLQEVWNDGLPPQQVGTLFCRDLQLASKNLNGNILRLFDNNEFRAFDDAGWHPAYLVGASVLNSLIKRLHFSGLRGFWNQVGASQDPLIAAHVLSQIIAPGELNTELRGYFSDLAKEIQTKSGVSCVIDGN